MSFLFFHPRINFCFFNLVIIFTDGAAIVESTIQILNHSFAIVIRPIGALGIDNDVKKPSYRIIIFSICFFGTLVYWSYCAVLTSLLTISDTPLTINKLDDMLGYSQFKLYYHNGTSAFNYFSKANKFTNPIASQIYEEYYNTGMYQFFIVINFLFNHASNSMQGSIKH